MQNTLPRPVVLYGNGQRLTEPEIRVHVQQAIASGRVKALRADRLIVGIQDDHPSRPIREEWRAFIRSLGICRVHLGEIRPGWTVVDRIVLQVLIEGEREKVTS